MTSRSEKLSGYVVFKQHISEILVVFKLYTRICHQESYILEGLIFFFINFRLGDQQNLLAYDY